MEIAHFTSKPTLLAQNIDIKSYKYFLFKSLSLFQFSPLLISDQCHTIIYWWISKCRFWSRIWWCLWQKMANMNHLPFYFFLKNGEKWKCSQKCFFTCNFICVFIWNWAHAKQSKSVAFVPHNFLRKRPQNNKKNDISPKSIYFSISLYYWSMFPSALIPKKVQWHMIKHMVNISIVIVF